MASLDIEPTWKYAPETGTYTRPLLASEASNDMVNTVADGCAEPYMGVTFTCKFPQETLVDGLKEALARLRFHAPLLAASILGDIGKRVWHYKCAPNYSDVLGWAEKSLSVTENAPPVEDFVPVRNLMKLPYTHGLFDAQYFGADLLCHGDNTYSLLLHGTHAIFDGQVTLDATHCLFQSLTAPKSEPSANELAWGTEWKNLPTGIITAIGGAPKGWSEGVPALSQEVNTVVQNPKPSLGLHPERSKIAIPGQPVRAQRVIDLETSRKVLAEVRRRGYTITVLFEAAAILSVFDLNSESVNDDAHVTLDITIVALQKYIVPPYNLRSRLASSLSIFPLFLRYKDVPQATQQERLITVMGLLKSQYAHWLANPYLPYIGSWGLPATNPNPYAVVITNVGVVERSVAASWPIDASTSDLEVVGLTIAHRQAQQTRPAIHLWSIRGELHIQLQCSDIWSKAYFEGFLERVVGLALSLVDAPPPRPSPSRTMGLQSLVVISSLAIFAIAVGVYVSSRS